MEWRKAWADVTNRYLERYGHDERTDHRSHAERGLIEQPTIHEGVVARAFGYILPTTERIRGKRPILLINYLLTMIINIILIASKILYKISWYSLPDVNKKLYPKIITLPRGTILTQHYTILYIIHSISKNIILLFIPISFLIF